MSVSFLWDYENIKIPAMVSPAQFVESIRKNTLFGNEEATFILVCDRTKEKEDHLEELKKEGVTILNIKADQPNAVDDTIINLLHWMGKIASRSSVIILLTSDDDFRNAAIKIRKLGQKIVLLHDDQVAKMLLNEVNADIYSGSIVWPLYKDVKFHILCSDFKDPHTIKNRIKMVLSLKHINHRCHVVSKDAAIINFEDESASKKALQILDRSEEFGSMSYKLIPKDSLIEMTNLVNREQMMKVYELEMKLPVIQHVLGKITFIQGNAETNMKHLDLCKEYLESYNKAEKFTADEIAATSAKWSILAREVSSTLGKLSKISDEIVEKLQSFEPEVDEADHARSETPDSEDGEDEPSVVDEASNDFFTEQDSNFDGSLRKYRKIEKSSGIDWTKVDETLLHEKLRPRLDLMMQFHYGAHMEELQAEIFDKLINHMEKDDLLKVLMKTNIDAADAHSLVNDIYVQLQQVIK